MKKFELTSETKTWCGRTLHRIRALISFGDVTKGELGGFVEKEENLVQSGHAWVYGNARVSGNAWVFGDARVDGDARVYGTGAIFWIVAVGPRNETITFFACKDKKIRAVCGDFFGTLEEFAAEVQAAHGDSRQTEVYMLAIEMAKARIGLTDLPEDEDSEKDHSFGRG